MNDEVKPDFREAKKKPKVKRPWKIAYRLIDERIDSRFRGHLWEFGRYETEKQRNQAFEDVKSKKEYVKREYHKIDPERK